MDAIQSSLLDQFTPSELALLYADRFMTSFPDSATRHVRPLLSQRYVDGDALAAFVVRALVGALLATGRVQLEAEGGTWWCRGRDVIVQLESAGDAWHPESPEGMLIAWLADRPAEERRLGEGVAATVLSPKGPTPGLVGVHARLARTGLTRVESRRYLLFFSGCEVQVDAELGPQLASVADDTVRARLAPALTALTPPLRALVSMAHERAVELNTPPSAL